MNKQEFSEDKWFFQDYRINKWWGQNLNPSLPSSKLWLHFLTPLGEVDGVCISIAPRSSQKCAALVQGTCYYSSSHPNSKGHSQGHGSLRTSNPRSGSLLQVWAYSPEPFYPLKKLEGPRASFWKSLPQTGPPLNPIVVLELKIFNF